MRIAWEMGERGERGALGNALRLEGQAGEALLKVKRPNI